ncbi:MAG: hypothetical protein JWL77_687 [Chthonomonadaceae bacterium]|nr:hypothetical protein [Chthonomonadaceae bacterium]
MHSIQYRMALSLIQTQYLLKNALISVIWRDFLAFKLMCMRIIGA